MQAWDTRFHRKHDGINCHNLTLMYLHCKCTMASASLGRCLRVWKMYLSILLIKVPDMLHRKQSKVDRRYQEAIGSPHLCHYRWPQISKANDSYGEQKKKKQEEPDCQGPHRMAPPYLPLIYGKLAANETRAENWICVYRYSSITQRHWNKGQVSPLASKLPQSIPATSHCLYWTNELVRQLAAVKANTLHQSPTCGSVPWDKSASLMYVTMHLTVTHYKTVLRSEHNIHCQTFLHPIRYTWNGHQWELWDGSQLCPLRHSFDICPLPCSQDRLFPLM